MRRLAPLPLLVLALVLPGCAGDDAVTPPPAAAAEKTPKPVKVMPYKRFVKRVNAICAGMQKPVRAIVQPPAITGDVAHNRRVFGAWFGRWHKVFRQADRRMGRLGMPSRQRLRWRRAKAKMHAIVGHMDTVRAAVWAGSLNMLILSARQLERSADSAVRRFRRFGATRCD
jgi:hypothetical protein